MLMSSYDFRLVQDAQYGTFLVGCPANNVSCVIPSDMCEFFFICS